MKNYTIKYGGVSIVRAKSRTAALKRVRRWIAEALDDSDLDTTPFDLISTITTEI